MPSYFDEPEKAESPRLSVWRAWKAGKPDCERVVVDVTRERTGIVVAPPQMIVRLVRKDGSLIDFKEAPYETLFERWLLDEEQARGESVESEVIRADLLLRESFQPTRQEVGPDYFDSVLLTELRQGELREYPSIADVLNQVHRGNPSGAAFGPTKRAIVTSIQSVWSRLFKLYPGNPDQAKFVLARGMASFLDERFSITNRRLLGWK